VTLHAFNAEGQPNGTAFTATNASTGSGDAVQVSNAAAVATFSTDFAAHGTKSIKSTAGSGQSVFMYQNGYSDAQGACQVQGYFTALPTSTAEEVLQIRTAGGNVAKLLVLSNGTVQVATGGGANVAVSTGFTVPLNTWTRFDLRAVVGSGSPSTNGTIYGQFSPLDSTTPTWTGGATNVDAGNAVNIADYRAGKLTAAAVPSTIYFDDFKWDNGASAFIPAVAATPLTATVSCSPTSSTAPYTTTATTIGTGGTGTALTYAWAWGDGTTTAAGASASVAHTYSASGTYTITVTVANS
jgi:hypothetical protein